MSTAEKIEMEVGSELVEKVLRDAQLKTAQQVMHEVFQKPGFTARQALAMLQHPMLQPWLDELTVAYQAKSASANDQVVQLPTEKRRGRPPGSVNKKPALKVEKAEKPVVEKPVVEKERTYNTFTPEQRREHQEFIYKLVSASPVKLTTSEIVAATLEKYPDMNKWQVGPVLEGLCAGKHIKASRKPGTKAYKYSAGKNPL